MGKKKVVLQLERLHPQAEKILDNKTICLRAKSHLEAMNLAAQNPVAGIITRGKGQVDYDLIHSCQNLQAIARAGVGLDNVNVDEASTQGIKVLNLPGSNAATVAEHVFTLMLSLSRNLRKTLEEVRNDNWSARDNWMGQELRGKSLGVLGLGNVGSKVAKLGKAFGMKVSYWDIYVNNKKYKHKSLEKLLSTSNIITIHLPSVGETTEMLDDEKIGFMPKGSLLINCARGEIVNENSVFQALNSGHLAGYGADVQKLGTTTAKNPLLSHPRAYITPHIASLTETTYKEICSATVNNLLVAISGKEVSKKFVANRKKLKNGNGFTSLRSLKTSQT